MPETVNLSQEQLVFYSDESLKVNKEDAIIEGVSVLTIGETRDGRFVIDEEFAEATVKFGNKKKKGQKSRFGHPSFFGNDALGTVVGKFKDFRIKGKKVLADLHFLESARVSPVFSQDPVEFLLSQAAEAPDVFGVSIVFGLERVFDDDGNLIRIKMTELSAVDVVDEPAANHNGLFSNQNPTQEELQMKDEEKKAQEEALAKKSEDAKKEGDKSARDLFSVLSEAFPGEHEFVAKQFSAGATVEEARVAFKDVEIERLKKSNTDSEAKLKTQEEALAKSKKDAEEAALANEGGEGSDALENDDSTSSSDAVYSAVDLKSAIDATQAEKKCTFRSAVKELKKTRPELFNKVIPKVPFGTGT